METTTLIIIGLAAILVAGAVFMITQMVLGLLIEDENPVRDRLRALQTADGEEVRKDREVIFEALVQLVEPFTRRFFKKNLSYQGQVKELLRTAGRADNDSAVWRFIAVQTVVGLILGAIGFVVILVVGMQASFASGLLMGAVSLGIGLLLGRIGMMMKLRLEGVKRKTEIRFNLPDTLDLMVVCVEAGLGLDSTIQRVGEETAKMAPDISYEFKRVNKELNAGIPRSEAFTNLGTRAGVDELRSLCNMIVQADKLGTSISQALRVYADDVRIRRKQKAEELAAKASIKMTFPLVLFIFPPLFIVLMGPMVIKMMSTFFG